MAKKDEIFKSFMKHELLRDKYAIDDNSIPDTVKDAKNSNIPIIKIIGELVDSIDSNIDSDRKTDLQTYDLLTRYLSTIEL
jgi:hypothetical protein